MSDDDRRRWNHRYGEMAPHFEPSPNLAARTHWLRPPHAMDGARPAALELACGFGGNALFLAELGYSVLAVDVSDVAIAALQLEIARRQAAGHRIHCTTQLADLDAFVLPPQAYDLIVAVRFLDRRLFAPAMAALRPGGLLYWETFTAAARGEHQQMRPDFWLAPGELRRLCAPLGIVDYAEDDGRGLALCLGRRSD